MLLRFGVYMLAVALTWKTVEYVYNRNFSAGIYPPEADSISIPIITTHIFLTGFCIFALPTVVLGNRWIFGKIVECRRWLQCIVAMVIFSFYLFSIFFNLSVTTSHLDRDHVEVGLASGMILISVLGFSAWDSIRFFKQVWNKSSAVIEL